MNNRKNRQKHRLIKLAEQSNHLAITIFTSIGLSGTALIAFNLFVISNALKHERPIYYSPWVSLFLPLTIACIKTFQHLFYLKIKPLSKYHGIVKNCAPLITEALKQLNVSGDTSFTLHQDQSTNCYAYTFLKKICLSTILHQKLASTAYCIEPEKFKAKINKDPQLWASIFTLYHETCHLAHQDHTYTVLLHLMARYAFISLFYWSAVSLIVCTQVQQPPKLLALINITSSFILYYTSIFASSHLKAAQERRADGQAAQLMAQLHATADAPEEICDRSTTITTGLLAFFPAKLYLTNKEIQEIHSDTRKTA